MRRDRSLLLPPQPQGRLPDYFVKIHKPVLRSAIRRPYSVYSFPHSLTVCLPDGLESPSYSIYRPAVCRSRPSPIPRSAVCHPPSIFVYSLPHSWTVCPPNRLKPVLRFAVRRLTGWKARAPIHRPSPIPQSAVRRPRSAAIVPHPSRIHRRMASSGGRWLPIRASSISASSWTCREARCSWKINPSCTA
jgi:hypothetical protein